MTGQMHGPEGLAIELLRSVESHDRLAITKALNKLIPRHAEWVVACLAVVAFVNIKELHGDDWPAHFIASLEAYAKEAS